MKRPSRRSVLLGGASLVALAAIPIAAGGLPSFLRRVLADHFGPDVLEIEGIEDFVTAFAESSGEPLSAKRIAAEVYFAWRGDKVKMIGQAEALEARFLQTILTRSNIIAIRQGSDAPFEFVSADPWDVTCSLYLSAFAEDSTLA